jgi:hypothetical protein
MISPTDLLHPSPTPHFKTFQVSTIYLELNKVKVKVKFTLEQTTKAQRGSSFNLGARWWRVVNATPRQLYPRERDPVPIV